MMYSIMVEKKKAGDAQEEHGDEVLVCVGSCLKAFL